MSFLELLNPVIFWQVLKKVLINARNRNYYVKQMRLLDESGTLKQIGMRLDMRSRAYYILNLEPETLMMGAEVLELERSRVMESINARKSTFEKAGLYELIEIDTTRIKNDDYYAYLIQVKYRKSASIWNLLHVITWSIGFAALLYYIVSRLPQIVEFGKSLIS